MEQKASEALKMAITSAPVQVLPDPTLPYIVSTDASMMGIEAMQAQQ